ncbi:MAG TPA: helicase-related protein, partial [Rhodospirillales bacterium]|nr:helicase-related protein [Rhodospirillales bacterium]
VWVLNGPDTLLKLLKIRETLGVEPSRPEFYVLGRVRMRMGFHWRPAFVVRREHRRQQTVAGDVRSRTFTTTDHVAACPACGTIVTQEDPAGEIIRLGPDDLPADRRLSCTSCGGPLWTLVRRKAGDARTNVRDALVRLPTIGPKTAETLIAVFGAEALQQMLADNIYELTNLVDGDGEFVFSDRRALRLEKALGSMEFAFGQGDYQPSEFIKRYFPDGTFGCCLVDEGHEYKAASSAQALAMAVLAGKARKVILLTGTLMGGYADDLFYLIWRLLPQRMMQDGFRFSAKRSLAPAAARFMEQHGVLKQVHRETIGGDFKTAKGKRARVHISRAPGFGPDGIARWVLPFTCFLKLADIDGKALPAYREDCEPVPLLPAQAAAYRHLSATLGEAMRKALARGDTTLLGVVLQVLLRWPDTCFRPETVRHPRSRETIVHLDPVCDANERLPKERDMQRICAAHAAAGRKVLLYTVYTGKHDLAGRYKTICEEAGLKAAVLRSTVPPKQREEWIMARIDAGLDVLVCNPELVKTGLDLYDFPTIVFAQTGYSVFTLQQASRRSWRIGQTKPVEVLFRGYAGTAQIGCLALMARKIACAQSTSGEVPESGLDVLNQDGDSVEMALARQLLAA